MAMTTEEHTLVLLMLTKLRQQQNLILEILQSRDIIEEDDAAAFESMLTDDEARIKDLYQQTRSLYKKTAQTLRIKVGGL